MGYFLGIDFGGTRIKVGLVNSQLELTKKIILPVKRNLPPEEIATEIQQQVRKNFPAQKIQQVGCGICGDVDYLAGLVRFSPNLGWRNVYWREILQRKLRRKVMIENDANAATWGIKIKSYPNARNLVGITLGTGIGGGIICEGRIYRGSSGSAGEVGHINIQPDGPRCNCGSYGCLEAYIGAEALARYACQRIAGGEKSRLPSTAGITPAVIYQAAVAGDKFARDVFVYMGKILGIALADIINVFNPEIIVLMGGVSRAKKFFLPALRQSIRQRTFHSAYQAVKIVVSPQEDEPGIVGAAFLHLNE